MLINAMFSQYRKGDLLKALHDRCICYDKVRNLPTGAIFYYQNQAIGVVAGAEAEAHPPGL